jgi:hypothetical protein
MTLKNRFLALYAKLKPVKLVKRVKQNIVSNANSFLAAIWNIWIKGIEPNTI